MRRSPSGVARISIASVAGIGLLLILSLAARGSERAIMLIPTWFLLAVWVAAAGATAFGYVDQRPGLAGPDRRPGADRAADRLHDHAERLLRAAARLRSVGGDGERRALAMTGCGDAIFDWNVVADQIYVSGDVETQLGLKRGALEGPAASWLDVLHPLDRDRYAAALDGLLQSALGTHPSRYPPARLGRAIFLVPA